MQIEQVGFDIPFPKYDRVGRKDLPGCASCEAGEGSFVQSMQEVKSLQPFEKYTGLGSIVSMLYPIFDYFEF